MIDSLIDQPLLQRILALWLIMAVESLWLWPAQYHPLLLFRVLAQRMAIKVNPNDGRSRGQRLVSGTLAPLVLLLPVAICMGIFISFAEYPVFFDALLLLAALDYRRTRQRIKHVTGALRNSKKTLARDQAKQLLLRQTDTLSAMGLSKGMLETGLLRYLTHYWTVLFVFLLAGGLAAFFFRVLAELAQVWNTKLADCRDFGRPAAVTIGVIRYLPEKLAMLAIMLIQGMRPAVAALRRRPKSASGSTTILAVTGGALGIRLGGPAVYQGRKYRFPRVGGSRDPHTEDIPRLLRLLNALTLCFLTFSLLLFAIIFASTTGRL